MIRGSVRSPPEPWCAGDDAALVSGTVACVDSVTFDRHMPPGMTHYQFGWMATAVSLSDLAAMGARPTGVLAAMLLPRELEADCVVDIVKGMDGCAKACGTFVYGGDTKPGAGSISTTALGLMENRNPMTRSGASPGDFVAVTGTLGGPASGYECLVGGWDVVGDFKDAVRNLYEPIPRVAEGILLSGSGAVTSCVDLSDGLATAANSVSEASGVGILFEEGFLPMSPAVAETSRRSGISEADLMTSFGGEYELMFTFNKKRLGDLHDLGLEFSVIGYVDDREGVRLDSDGKERRLEYGRY